MENIRNWFVELGERSQPFLPFLEDQPPLLVGAGLAIIVLFLLAAFVWLLWEALAPVFRSAFGLLTSDEIRQERAQRNEIRRRQHQLTLMRHKIERELSKLQGKILITQVKDDWKFKRVSASERFFDTISALVASTAPRSILPIEFERFRASVEHGRLGAVRRVEAQAAKDILALEAELPRTLAQANEHIAQCQSHLGYLNEEIAKVQKRVSELENPDKDEISAKEDVYAWEKRLGRPAYSENFESFFEKNLTSWMQSHSENKTREAIGKNSNTSRAQFGISLLFRTLWEWLKSSIANVVKIFPVLAAPAELLYSVPIFLALANGDDTAAWSGAIVFTIGLFTLGSMAGICLMRMRWRDNRNSPDPSQAMIRWRPLTAIAAFALIGAGLYSVYSGAGLRAIASDVTRVNQDVESHRSAQGRANDSLNQLSFESDPNGDQRARIQAQIDATQDRINTAVERRDELVAEARIPFDTLEGRIALIVFLVFFAGAVARQTLSHDPEFEFSMVQKKYAETQWLRLRKLFHSYVMETFLRLHRHLFQNEIDSWERKKTTAQEEHEKTLETRRKELDERPRLRSADVASYCYTRCLVFASILLRFRASAREQIGGALEQMKPSPKVTGDV